MAVPAKRKTTNTADDGDDEPQIVAPEMTAATEDENDEHSQILETLKDDNANDSHSV